MCSRLLLGSLLGLTLFLAVPALAQDGSDGSLYSRFGIGTLQSFGSSQIEGIGGAGIGLPSFGYANFRNPAAWSDQILTRAMVGLTYENITITDAADNTSRLTAGALNAVQFSFPILTRRLGAAISFQPYSRTNYRVQEEGFLRPDPTLPDSVAFAVDHEGRGGLQQVMAGLGYRFSPSFTVGANVTLLFGILEDARRTTFPGGSDYAETDLVAATRLAGVSGRIGALYTTRGLLATNDQFSVGGTFTLPATLYGARVRTLGESLDRDTLGTRTTGSVRLPLGAGLGVAYRPDNRWTLAADAEYQAWSDFTSEFDFPGYTVGGTSAFTDRVRMAAGVEFLPAGVDLLRPYFERVAYRFGVWYDHSYVSPNADVDLRTIALTGGLSLPTLIPGTHIDVNMDVGTRGTTDRGMVRDLFYRLSATLNVGERWFQKQKLR